MAIAYPTLMASHADFLARWKAHGRPTQAFRTPCCNERLETTAPDDRREKWDSLTTCPYCGGMFMKVVTANSVSVRMAEMG